MTANDRFLGLASPGDEITIIQDDTVEFRNTGQLAMPVRVYKATDDLTAALDLNIDSFVESYMGRYGRPKVSGSIKLHNFSESAAKSFVAQQTTYLTKVLPKKIKSTDTDLLNLRDTILGDLTKVLYLFTLA